MHTLKKPHFLEQFAMVSGFTRPRDIARKWMASRKSGFKLVYFLSILAKSWRTNKLRKRHNVLDNSRIEGLQVAGRVGK